jgi:response regulator of citrate/malate metabolism
LLVDDDTITNYIHETHIEYCEVADCIQVASDGQVTLDIITKKGLMGLYGQK